VQIHHKTTFTAGVNDWVHIIFVPKCPVLFTESDGNSTFLHLLELHCLAPNP
jgi:hypothetical protein